eukprot:753986-Hanusia_phi.AAC.11
MWLCGGLTSGGVGPPKDSRMETPAITQRHSDPRPGAAGARPRSMSKKHLPHLAGQGIRALATSASYKNILVEKRGKVALLTLNRPKALNALNSELMGELQDAMTNLDADTGIGAFVLTGKFWATFSRIAPDSRDRE